MRGRLRRRGELAAVPERHPRREMGGRSGDGGAGHRHGRAHRPAVRGAVRGQAGLRVVWYAKTGGVRGSARGAGGNDERRAADGGWLGSYTKFVNLERRFDD